MTFSHLVSILGSRDAKKIGNNTYAERRGECIAIRLHATDVLTYSLDGSCRFDSGGYQTATTKARLNEHGPSGCTVYADRGIWYVTVGGKTYAYADGLIVRPNGTVENAGNLDESKALKKQIAQYVKAYVAKLIAGEVVLAKSDCLFCQGIVTTMDGKRSTDTGHLRSHVEEGYYVGPVVWAALQESGTSAMVKHFVAHRLSGQPLDGGPAGFVQKPIEKALRRYLHLQLGLAA